MIVGRLAAYDLSPVPHAEPRIITPRWQVAEYDLFKHIRACYKIAKIDPPEEFINGVRNGDITVVTAQVDEILKSDVHMSCVLRRRCKRWLENRAEAF